MKNRVKFLNDKKLILMAVVLFFAIAVFHTYHSYLEVQEEQKKFALAESKILNDFMFIHREYYQKLFIDKTIKLDEETLKALPAYSAYDISQKFSKNNDYNIKVQTVSNRARNHKNQADKEEIKSINYFEKNKDKKEYFKYIDDVKEPYYQYSYALRITKSCLNCHGKKEDAPKFIVDKYKNAYDYKLGETRGIISVKIPKEHTHDYVHDRFIKNSIFNLLTLVFILVAAILVLIKRSRDIELLQAETIKAESANKAKSEFLANMSHEIRTPLNAILGFVEFLQEEETDKKKLKYLNTIDKSSYSLLGVINDILDFSKIESAKLEIDKINFNPIEEFESTSALFCAKAEEKNLHFNTYIDENIPKILYSDPLRLKQVLSNLLSNAIKFSKKDGLVELKIEYIQDTNRIKFSVIDDGIGISQEYQKNIFKPFTQEQSSTTRNYGGTGLGLTISFQLLNMLESELKLNSKVGAGSEFYFELDVQNVCQINLDTSNLIKEDFIGDLKIATVFSEQYGNKKETIKKYLKALGIKYINDFDSLVVEKFENIDMVILDSFMFEQNLIEDILNSGKSVIVIKSGLSNSIIIDLHGKVKELECPVNISDLHDIFIEFFSKKILPQKQTQKQVNDIKLDAYILLVEDNIANQMFMKVVLEKIGLRYDIANDGLEAVEKFGLNKYDIILMDENMPNMGGIEATKNILKLEKEKNLKHTPIIALTANALKGDRERFLNSGMDEYITKPLNREKLIDILRGFLE